MNRLNDIYTKAQKLNATGIMIECKRKNIFSTEFILSFKINDKMIKHFYLHKDDYNDITSFLESKITISNSEVKQKTYWDKSMSFESNRVLVSRHFKTLFIEFDNNKDNVLPFMAVAA
ncbi:hypothetical protein [Vreelandella neptunia]|uniref:Uncharacterized protein n=1 Tax=Vreelandella neptunia TaxID=115551 RepID=A0ABS9S9T7_9GAMM|nr:hypothetical protein [Halomonas neptunia]MCH4812875.1 hypothetical protein [Halomonas neptunia]